MAWIPNSETSPAYHGVSVPTEKVPEKTGLALAKQTNGSFGGFAKSVATTFFEDQEFILQKDDDKEFFGVDFSPLPNPLVEGGRTFCTVKSVERGSLARQCGVQCGMRVRLINGSSVRDTLTEDRLGDLVRLWTDNKSEMRIVVYQLRSPRDIILELKN